MAYVPGRIGLPRWTRWAAYGQILLTFLLLRPACTIKLDKTTESFSDQASEMARLNQEFFRTFGQNEIVLLVYTGKDLFDEGSLDAQLEALEKIESLPLVKSVLGIPQVFRDLFGAEDPDALNEEILSTPFYEGSLISKDAKVAGLLMEIEKDPDGTQHRGLLRSIREAAAPLRDHGFQIHLVGSIPVAIVLEDTTRAEMGRTFPPAFICSALVLLLLFRSFRAAGVALLCMAITVILTLGIMSLVGPPLNLVTVAFPILLWALGLASLIHLIRRYQELLSEGHPAEESISMSLSATAMPCVVSIATTAMGFLSLCTTRLAPVKQLAIWVSLGLAISVIVSCTVGPLFIQWFRVPAHRKRPTGSVRWTHTLSRLALKIRTAILILSAALLVLSLLALPKVRVETSNLAFLSKKSELVQSCEFVRQHFTGIYALDVVVDIPPGWLDTRTWPVLADMEKSIASFDGVAKVLSPLDMLRKLNQWDHEADPAFYKLPETQERAQALVDLLGEEGEDRLKGFLAQDGKLLRMTVLITAIESTSIFAIRDHLQACLEVLPKPLKGYVAGSILRSMQEQLDLVNSQAQSFGVAIAMIYLCILIGLRSWRLTLVSLFPNIMPVLCVFALMVVFDSPLNTVTVMVAGVALGISVEDVVHLLSAYKGIRKAGKSATSSICEALDAVGPAVAMTTFTACIGFFALARSSFVPIRAFGLLSSLAMLVALMNNLFLVPAILTFRERRRGSGDQAGEAQGLTDR